MTNDIQFSSDVIRKRISGNDDGEKWWSSSRDERNGGQTKWRQPLSLSACFTAILVWSR